MSIIERYPDLALLDATGRRRPRSTMPGYRRGTPPPNKGRRYDPEILEVSEIAKLLEHLGEPRKYEGWRGELSRLRLRALVILLWRSGLRISEALALVESDLNAEHMTVLVRRGKGGRRRTVQLDRWAWAELEAWLVERRKLPIGQVFCVVSGPTAGRAMSAYDVRTKLRVAGRDIGLRKRVAPHQFRHTHAAELWREEINMLAIQRQLGHARLDVTQRYLQALGNDEVLIPIGQRQPPMVPLG